MKAADELRPTQAGPVPENTPYWRCSNCRYVLQAATPPAVCPSCNQSCQFDNVTCYIPECGFTGIDSRLV
ncbi:MAG: rubredoxin-like domain-containing protein [candidate division WOR-3 bacterium]